MTVREFPAIGFDPTPGSLRAVTALADGLGEIARQLGEAHTDLTTLGKADGIWTGAAARTFAESVEDLPEYLETAHSSFSDASQALSDWATDLADLQFKAANLERDAVAALAKFEQAQANPALRLAGQSFPEGPDLERAQQALDTAENAVREAGEKLEALRKDAVELYKQHLTETARVGAALDKAREAAPDAPMIDIGGMLDSIGDALSGIADVLATIGDVLSAVGNVLGVLAIATSWIPGVGAVVALAATGASVAAAGTKVLAKAGGADVSWGSIAMDTVGALPLGQAVAGAKNAAVQAARSTRAGKTVGKLPGLGQEPVEMMTKVGGELRKVKVDPIPPGALREPGRAIEEAAKYAHFKAVNTVNKALDKVGKDALDPYSAAGMAAGAAYRAAGGFVIGEGARQAHDRLTD